MGSKYFAVCAPGPARAGLTKHLYLLKEERKEKGGKEEGKQKGWGPVLGTSITPFPQGAGRGGLPSG